MTSAGVLAGAVAGLAQVQEPVDDVSPMIAMFVLAALGALAVVVVVVVALAGVLTGATIATVVVAVAAVLLGFVVLTLCFHLLLAMLIWTRRPGTRVLMHPRWWGLATLPGGLFVAIPFFVLHYWSGAPRRCYRCGYDLRGLVAIARCPECSAAR